MVKEGNMSDTATVQSFPPELLCFVSPDGEFQALKPLIRLAGEQAVKAANVDLLSSFGCEGTQIDEGFKFLCEISLSSTFNSWANDDEGSSGISSKALVASATSPGAVLTLVGLLKAHPDASASGSLTLNFANPARRAGSMRPR